MYDYVCTDSYEYMCAYCLRALIATWLNASHIRQSSYYATANVVFFPLSIQIVFVGVSLFRVDNRAWSFFPDSRVEKR